MSSDIILGGYGSAFLPCDSKAGKALLEKRSECGNNYVVTFVVVREIWGHSVEFETVCLGDTDGLWWNEDRQEVELSRKELKALWRELKGDKDFVVLN